MKALILHGDCSSLLEKHTFEQHSLLSEVDLTFLDPPFNQGKAYNEWGDNLPQAEYWLWMHDICAKIYALTSDGGAVYFMQREKNTEFVLRCLRESRWTLQNLIIWKKKTSAVPGMTRYGKGYQIIAFATKGMRPRVFHRLRINPPLPPGYKFERENGMFVTDVWDDIRELTSGYFAGDEALRDLKGNRAHKQQAPIQLLLRILLSSTNPDDLVLDAFAGTGTTLVVAEQLDRKSIGIEIDPFNVELIQKRLVERREADSLSRFFKDYACTPDLKAIWGTDNQNQELASHDDHLSKQMTLFESTNDMTLVNRSIQEDQKPSFSIPTNETWDGRGLSRRSDVSRAKKLGFFNV
ncbi:site-specific DNA-methyltransferase [Candidatus Poribacteria bacterium]|nr:site-specific DNA-methyltransferase [Candidatus Poribacteria bacterium]